MRERSSDFLTFKLSSVLCVPTTTVKTVVSLPTYLCIVSELRVWVDMWVDIVLVYILADALADDTGSTFTYMYILCHGDMIEVYVMYVCTY